MGAVKTLFSKKLPPKFTPQIRKTVKKSISAYDYAVSIFEENWLTHQGFNFFQDDFEKDTDRLEEKEHFLKE